MTTTDTHPPIWAAGAVALREGQVALVHRPKYDDWTLAKGKAEDGELLPATAVREVFEETGLAVRLGAPLTPLRYFVEDGLKLVAWWKGEIVDEDDRTAAPSEIDAVTWVTPEEALTRLTYADERRLLVEALAQPPSTPLLLVRHAKAVKRKDWTGSDRDRPLSPNGFLQLPFLNQVLGAYGVDAIVTSPAVRCATTVLPFAEANEITLRPEEILTEEAGAADPAAVAALTASLAQSVGRSGIPTAICLHRPNRATMLGALGIPDHPMAPAAVIVAHVGPDGTVVATEWHDSVRVELD
ncbi:MAG: NUDIX hydrolase [Propionibacteriaceae bacterium]|nr:NUDIX hydrolase [Propionibacteriaceae bacterium]